MRELAKAGRLVAVAMCLGVSAAATFGQAGLSGQIGKMVAEPAVARAHWGVMVTGMDGTPIYRLNEGQFFQPASNNKLFTTAAAIALLGGNRQWTTRVLLEGTDDDNEAASPDFVGDLVLKGVGDANLSGRMIPYTVPDHHAPQPETHALRYLEELADQVKKSGIRSISGNVIGDDTTFPWEPYPDDWTIDDAVGDDGAPVSALTVNDNRLKLTITPGPVGQPPSIALLPATTYYQVDMSAVTVEAKSAGRIVVDRAPGSKVLRVYGTIAADAGPIDRYVAIADPAEFAATTFREMLVARGLMIEGKAVARHRLPVDHIGFLAAAGKPLDLKVTPSFDVKTECVNCEASIGSHTSSTLLEDLTVTNKVSQNLHAEMLLRQLGLGFGEDGSTAQGARVVRQFLLNAGVDKDDFVFYDGSGLSGHDLVTPRAAAKLLQFAATQPWFAEWKKSLPVGGVDGSLEGRFTKAPLKGHVFAKTGTLGEARALSGYLDCASGRTVIFSVMVGNHAPGTSADRDVMDRMVEAIAAAN